MGGPFLAQLLWELRGRSHFGSVRLMRLTLLWEFEFFFSLKFCLEVRLMRRPRRVSEATENHLTLAGPDFSADGFSWRVACLPSELPGSFCCAQQQLRVHLVKKWLSYLLTGKILYLSNHSSFL